jgi:hypothetical protein
MADRDTLTDIATTVLYHGANLKSGTAVLKRFETSGRFAHTTATSLGGGWAIPAVRLVGLLSTPLRVDEARCSRAFPRLLRLDPGDRSRTACCRARGIGAVGL